MNIEFNLWPWVRNLCKYGDCFITLEIAEGEGVINVHPQSVYYVTRTEGLNDPQRINRKEQGIKFTVDPDKFGIVPSVLCVGVFQKSILQYCTQLKM